MKPLMILDNHFRQRDELFSEDTYAALSELVDIHGGVDQPMPRSDIMAHLPDAAFYVSARPELSVQDIAQAPNLKATIEVAGAFRDGLEYTACLDRGIEVLSCSPGFRNAVAEMALAMMLGAGRGLVAEHEAFRTGNERWLDDRTDTDFTLYNQTIGFIGFGQIARETHRLLAPFSPRTMAYDPFVTDAGPDVDLVDLDTLVHGCKVVVVAAVPSEETRGLLSAAHIAAMPRGTLVVVISRAWCVDFDALVEHALSGHIQVATDVFPYEPLAADHPLRRLRGVILSPHRAAAVKGGRHLIGDMILHDVRAILDGNPTRQLKPVARDQVESLVAAQLNLTATPNT